MTPGKSSQSQRSFLWTPNDQCFLVPSVAICSSVSPLFLLLVREGLVGSLFIKVLQESNPVTYFFVKSLTEYLTTGCCWVEALRATRAPAIPLHFSWDLLCVLCVFCCFFLCLTFCVLSISCAMRLMCQSCVGFCPSMSSSCMFCFFCSVMYIYIYQRICFALWSGLSQHIVKNIFVI